MSDCLFCKIVAKEIPGEVVHESSEVLAFKDINPGAPTHVLVVPKRHIGSASELSDSDGELLAKMFTVMASVADQAGLSEGHRIVTNIGPAAGQSVPHLHFHVLGGRSLSWPPG